MSVNLKNHLTLIAFSLGTIILAFIINYVFIETIIIPDPCYYHTHDTDKIFDLFYNLNPQDGYHPSPTFFNYILTFIAGMIIPAIIFMKTRKKDGPTGRY